MCDNNSNAVKQNIEQQLFSESEVLKMLGVTRPTLERWRLKGYIKCVRIGRNRRYTKEQIDQFIKKFEV